MTTPVFFSLAPLQMSDSSAPLPLDSEVLSLGGVVLACEGTEGGRVGSTHGENRRSTDTRGSPTSCLTTTHLAEGGGRRRPRGRGRRGRNGHPVPRLARLSVWGGGRRLPTSPSPLGRHDTRQRLLRTQQSLLSIRRSGCSVVVRMQIVTVKIKRLLLGLSPEEATKSNNSLDVIRKSD